MKKFLVKAAALFAAAAFMITGNVAYAAEDASGGEPLVIDIPDAYFKIEVPDIYELVLDQKKEYRGSLADYGLDASDTMGTMVANHTRFDAIYIPGDYAIEAFCNYDPANDNIIIKDLSSFSDDEVEDFSSEVALNASTSVDGMQVTSYEDGIYRDKNGIAYGCMKMEYTEDDTTGSTTVGAYCMWTIVDGKTYYFYTKGYEPGVDGSVYKEETRALVDGVTYYNAPAGAASKDDDIAEQIIEEHISEVEDIDEILDKVKDSENTTNTTGKVQSDQEEQDVDDVIGNIYFQAGRVFAIVVVIMIIIGVIVAIISTNNAKKKRLNQQYYNGYNNGQNYYNNGYNNYYNGQNNNYNNGYNNGQSNFNNGYSNGQNNYNNGYNNGNINGQNNYNNNYNNGQNNFNNGYNNGNVNGQNNANVNGQNNYFNGNNNGNNNN